MQALTVTLQVALVILGLVLIALVLIHRGRGGGISDMFGGGIASGIQSTGSGERTLSRITWAIAFVWGLVVVLLGLVSRFTI